MSRYLQWFRWLYVQYLSLTKWIIQIIVITIIEFDSPWVWCKRTSIITEKNDNWIERIVFSIEQKLNNAEINKEAQKTKIRVNIIIKPGIEPK
jgi:hypothetical protein